MEEAQQTSGDAELCATLYQILGPVDTAKTWLAASLARTLKTFAYEARDYLAEADAAEFVCGIYRAALDRAPSDDDLQNRLAELEAGRTREDLVREIFDSEESRQRQLWGVLEKLGTEE